MTESVAAIEAKGLKKAFGSVVAVRKVDLVVPEGCFAVLLGPNGAGKTTLMRMIATLLRPSAGSVKIWGKSLDHNLQDIRRQIGLISHQLYLYPYLTARENLVFYGRLYALSNMDTRIDEALTEVGLEDVSHRLVTEFSRGMQQRLSIARALIHRPSLVLLDEPFTGLDHEAATVLAGLLRTLRDGHRSFLMVSHNLAQGAALADRIFIQVRGRLIHSQDINEMAGETLAQLYSHHVQQAATRK